MTNNDVLRRLRYALNLTNPTMKDVFAQGGTPATDADLDAWLRKDEESGYLPCPDSAFTAFLDGYILWRRGPRPEGGPVVTEERLTNNLILKKLRVALGWQEDQVLATLAAGGLTVSKNELSALFRKPGHKNYKACGDQLLRAFLTGMIGPAKGVPREPGLGTPV